MKNHDDFLSDEVFIIGADGKNEIRVTDNKVGDWPVAVSRDSSSVYTNTGELTFDLMRTSVKDRRTIPIIRFGAKGLACDVSHDEKKVVFISDRTISFEYEVFWSNMDGTNVRQLTTLKGYIGDVRFRVGSSTDATFVLEKKESRGEGTIFAIDCADGKMRRIAPNVVASINSRWRMANERDELGGL